MSVAPPTSRRSSRLFFRLVLLLSGVWLLAPAVALAAPVRASRVELDVQIDPGFETLYVQAKLEVQNPNPRTVDILELQFPAPLASRLQVKTAWDYSGELNWRCDAVAEGAPRPLRVALRSPLAPGKKRLVVVSYQLSLKSLANPAGAAVVSEERARLLTTGWYPWPAAPEPTAPQTLRLTVRLPKQWRVTAPAGLKKLREGTALATYELEVKPVEPEHLLFEAGAAVPASPGSF